MTWQIILIIYLILGTASYLSRRHLAKSLARHNRLVNGFFFLVVLYPTGLVIALFNPHNLDVGWFNLVCVLIGSAVWPVIRLLSYRASKDIDAGLFTIICNLAPIVTIVAASILLQERLNDQQLLGASILIGSAFMATLPHLTRRSSTKIAGLDFAIVSVVLMGLATVFERWMLTRMDFGTYLILGWGAQTLWMVAFAWPDRKYINIFRDKNNLRQTIWYALSNTFAGVCFVAALKLSGNVSLVSAFASFMTVTVVLAAFFFLKEKEWLWYKVAAAIIGIIGLIVLNMV
jgi:drug/metabolite transporter (DMT)-like permease